MLNCDFKELYTEGSLNNKLLYRETYSAFPNSLVKFYKQSFIDIGDINVNSLNPSDYFINESMDDTIDEWNSEWCNSLILFYNAHRIIISINKNCIIAYYSDGNKDRAATLINDICKIIPFRSKNKTTHEVSFVAYQNGYYTVDSEIKFTNVDIKKHYNDDFLPIYEDIIKFLNDRSNGLIVLHGNRGTGKSNLIRHLINTVPGKYIIVTNAMAEGLASPDFISFMFDNKDSVFILEDCEQVLMKRTDGFSNTGAIANILNMSDGLMSDAFNIKFICTFNSDINMIDEALLRKGRCFANYEFKPLSIDKSKILLEEQGIHDDVMAPMTLAEIYNYLDKDYSKQIKQFGFNV